jgi:hypothetical protein
MKHDNKSGLGHKSRLILVIALMLLILGTIGFLLDRRATFSPGEQNFRLEPGQHPDMIRISRPEEQDNILLERTSSGRWLLNQELDANESAVREAIRIISHLTVRQVVPLSEQEEVNKFLEEKGIRVEVYEEGYLIRLPFGSGIFPKEKKILDFLLGSDTPDGSSTYMRVTGANRAFIVHLPGWPDGVSKVFHAGMHVWRDPGIMSRSYQEVKVLKVNWTEKEEDGFLLSPGPDGRHELFFHNGIAVDTEKIDMAVLNRFLQDFYRLHYEKLLQEGEMPEHLARMPEHPFVTFAIKGDDDQDTLLLECFYSIPMTDDEWSLAISPAYDPNRFYLRMNKEEWAIAQFYVFNRVMRPVGFFLSE